MRSVTLMIALVATVSVIVGAWCALGANETPDVYLRAQTVIRGLAAREEAVGGVGGEAIVWSFYGPHYWKMIAGLGRNRPGSDLATGQSGDRDVALTRFRLGEQRYWYDVQMRLWAGGSPIGTPWFVTDFRRAAEDTDDQYLRVLSDGQYVYRHERSRSWRRRGLVQAERSSGGSHSVASYLGDTFNTALGFGVCGVPLSRDLGSMIESGWRVGECSSVVYDGQDCLRLVLLTDSEIAPSRYSFWIAPELGYAPVRCVYEFFHKDNPLRGQRFVYVWSGYKNVGGDIHLPHKYTLTYYVYKEEGREPWMTQTNYEFQRLVAPLGEPSLDPKEYFFPAGTRVARGNPDDMPLEEAAKMSGDFMGSYSYYADWVLAKPLPELNAEFNRPPTGQEMGEIERQYAAAGVP